MIPVPAFLRPPEQPLIVDGNLGPVERTKLLESARGELLVATMRALLLTAIGCLGLVTIIRGNAPLAMVEAARRLPVLFAPVVVGAWLWAAWLRHHPYRPIFSHVTTVFDVVLLCGISLVLARLRHVEGSEVTLLGATPPVLALFFTVAAAGVRQQPKTVMLAGALCVVGFGCVVLMATEAAVFAVIAPVLALTETVLAPVASVFCR